MLERLTTKKHTLARLRASVNGEHLKDFAASLFAAAYSRRSRIRYVNAAAHLGIWRKRAGIALEQIDEVVVQRFLDHLPRCRCQQSTCDQERDSRTGVNQFLKYLRQRGIISANAGARQPAIVDEFCAWMRSYRGLADSTLRLYAPLVAEFVEREGERPEDYDASGVRAFVLRRARLHGSDRARCVVTVLRMFLKFLSTTGRCPPALIGAVPTVASWRLAQLPRYTSAANVERVINACDVAISKGARDRAMILLMARLGLRSGEVAALRLEDLDWNHGRVLVVGKGGVEAWLPLPQEVGDAVLKYIERHRPPAPHEYIFIRMVPPWRRLHTTTVGDAVVEAMQRAGVEGRFRRAHMLRHSLATNLLRDGASLDQIGALLRHQSTTTTQIYAKVDLTSLRRVAQPWPTVEVS